MQQKKKPAKPTWIRHVVTEGLNEEGIQRCVICDAIIFDNRGMMSPIGTPPSKGYQAGNMYILPGNPMVTMVEEFFDNDKCDFIPCTIKRESDEPPLCICCGTHTVGKEGEMCTICDRR